jgi:hypothetical protein
MSATLFSETHSSSLKLFVQQPAIPQFRELLTQGVLAGSFAVFIHAIVFSFFTDNYYKSMIARSLHEFLAIGTLMGLAQGLVYWCYARLFQARCRPIARLLTPVVTVAVGYGVLEFFSAYFLKLPLLASWLGVQVISLSVMTGSQWRPWRALIYGVSRVNRHQRLPASVIGLLLRVTLLFLCFESIFILICELPMINKLSEFMIWWLVAVDFVIGLVIALVNPRFWLTLSLAIVTNVPWVYLLLLFRNDPGVTHVIICSYLLLWCAFLLTRCRTLDPLFSSIREELRYYYLVD